MRKNRLWIPVAGSLAVYLVPLIGPHAVRLVGEALLHSAGVADARSDDREPDNHRQT